MSVLRLNWMLSKRLFKKMPITLTGHETWFRSDCTVSRFTASNGERMVQFEYRTEAGKPFAVATYKADDPKVKDEITRLTMPFNHTQGPDQGESLEQYTRRAANAFDRWFTSIGNDPERDIQDDVVTISFNNQTFMIPMYMIDFLDATQRYLDTLNAIATQNEC